MKGLLGKKAGMTQLFLKDNRVVPVTLIEIEPNIVLKAHTQEKDGYTSLQLAVGKRAKEKNITKPVQGQYKKAGFNETRKHMLEIRDMSGFEVGTEIKIDDIFETGMLVDVTGTSKGKGFQGNIKRHNQSRGPMAHGSKFHRAPGSSGDVRGTVKSSKKMPGHMGADQVTTQNLEIVYIDLEHNVIAVKGAVPGNNSGYLTIRVAVKGLPNKDKVELANIQEELVKNHLLEEGKKVGAVIETEKMSIEEIKQVIEEARIIKEDQDKEREELNIVAEELKITNHKKMAHDELKEAITKAQELNASRGESTPVVEAKTEEVKAEETNDTNKEETTTEEKDTKEGGDE